MSGPLIWRSACLYLDPFPLSLDLSMMIQRTTSVNFSPGNIQPSSLHRIACLTWALYMVGRLPNANAHSLVLAQPAGVVDSCTHRHPPRGTSARRCQPLEPHPTTFCGRSATHCLCCEGELCSVVRVTNRMRFDANLKAGCSQVRS